VDTQNPTITLTADPDAYTLPGQEYAEEGYSAWDDYDGDISDRVVRTVSETEVVYTVEDSSGNRYETSRQIVYNDPVAPELTLLGDTKITVSAGSSFVDPGFTAIDNCDGDITDRVVVSGGIDPYLPGSYTISYTVEDSYGNTATASRTVTVSAGGLYNNGGTNGKIIYLTFDDGPSAHTPYLLDVLKKYGVKATFFVVNTGYIGTISRTAAEGHTVAIHSKTHNYKKIYTSEEAYFDDLYQMQQIIKNHTGKTTCMVRFPGGSSNTVSNFNPGIMTRLAQALGEKGFYYFDWNVSSGDAGLVDTRDEVFNNVIQGIKGRSASVVLQHDSHWYSVQAVEKIIVWGLVNGYTFLPMNENSPGCHHGIRN
jgi:peptidoglycan/xylan/chitin deacetylase (PgdA/CDA1 family)